MLHLYIGDGKGKTTAAMGLALRAAGRGHHVVIGQFLKGGSSGEVEAFSYVPGIDVISYSGLVKFTISMTKEELKSAQTNYPKYFESLVDTAINRRAGVVVWDEILDAVNANLLQVDEVLAAIKKLQDCEIIMTGRNPKVEFIEKADYISEIKKIKHPFDRGIKAREGIEY
ncbi:cob(I)yrinic acid a,c-diamide adenosyltransferase [Eubacterium oxidoreducens]|uniref:Cob(I)alamin adenosyltransferase n=1 Tax=Eubacterium oxidoreducens TaxID=1732 RepID=A0A1G6BAW5_EUBOX|nr:cob(I)yrinic acid a,c-diamide adenosyltransferase [Eubacterium oxidoreducens]SDB17791.1 cob(I)alamin adenosyltransferase [Eubacterium oxidoreducens]